MRNKTFYTVQSFIILVILAFSNACSLQPVAPLPDETPQEAYVLDSLPGCDNCTTSLNAHKLGQLVALIQVGVFGQIHSLIIIHNDEVVLEEYFRGWTRHMRHFLASATKSFTSTLIGIAQNQGFITSVDEKLLDFFPEYDDIANRDSQKESITLEHVLTMSAGFDWDELSEPYTDVQGNPNPENDAVALGQSGDWIKYMLDLPMRDEPGTRFEYNSGSSHLLSGLLQNSTGQTAEEFAAANLFNSLDITSWEWSADPNGVSTGGWGLSLHPANMALFGYLFLKKGWFNGRQVVPQGWVETSTSMHIAAAIQDNNLEYGYQWWRLPDETAEEYMEVNDIFYAAGAGGQVIFVIPHLNMVVATTAENFRNQGAAFTMLLEYILPAIENSQR